MQSIILNDKIARIALNNNNNNNNNNNKNRNKNDILNVYNQKILKLDNDNNDTYTAVTKY